MTQTAHALVIPLLLAAAELPGQSGWPRSAAPGSDRVQLQAAPALYDLDGDGKLEIIVPRMDDKLYVYAHDGTAFRHDENLPSNFPVNMGFLDGTFSSPAIGDVDGDGVVEIVLVGDNKAQTQARVRIFGIDGTLKANVALASNGTASGKATPCLIDAIRYKSTAPYAAHPALEIFVRDGDGQLHIIQHTGATPGDSTYTDRFILNDSRFQTVATNAQKDQAGRQFITPSVSAAHLTVGPSLTETYVVVPSTDGRIHHWIVSSAPASGQTFTLEALDQLVTGEDVTPRFSGSAVIVDFNDDGILDVIAGASNGKVYIWDGGEDGALWNEWTRTTDEGISGSPAVADVDNDGELEVIVGSEDSKVYIWKRDGSRLPGWPVTTGGDILASPAVANLDDTATMEVIVASADRSIYVFDSTGMRWDGWPKQLDSTLYSSPAVADLRNSGKASIIVGEYLGVLYCFDLPHFIVEPENPGQPWNQFRGGPRRTGAR